MIKSFNFKTALLLAAMAISATTFYSCNKDDDKPEDPVKPVNNDTPETPVTNEAKVEEISSSIKTLANAATDGKPVQLSMDANTTAQDVSAIAQALQQNSTVKVDLDLSKTEIVSVPAGAFKETKNLTSVTLPSKVAEISDNAFKGCTTLKSVTIKPTLTKSGTTIKIGASAFENCTALDSVFVPKADIETVEIDPTAFVGTKIALFTGNKFTSFEDVKTFCPESVLILAHVTEIPEKAFYKDWQSIYGEEYVKYNNDSILVSVIFADGIKLTQIADSAFKGCKNLENMIIPNGVKTIGVDAFWLCSNWKKPSVPEGVENIGDIAFCHVNMGDDFEIPSSVKSIGYQAFWWCDNGIYATDFAEMHFSVMLNNGRAIVTKLPIENNIIVIPNTWSEIPLKIGWMGPSITDITGVTFEKNSSVKKLIPYQFVSLYLDEIEIPASVTELDSLVFCGTNSLRKVTFEKSSKIEKIHPRAFVGVQWSKMPEEIHLPIFCELSGNFVNDNTPLPSGTTIYVPSNLVDKFTAAECYKNCEIIAEED